MYHVYDNTLVNLIRVLILIFILIQEFIESTTDNVIIVFTSQYIHVVVVRKSCFVIKSTSLQARSADLPASPAGLLCRFPPSGFALASRSLRSCAFRASRSRKFSKKKSVSQSTQNALKRVKMQKKNFLPFLTHCTLSA